ncbi:MAG: nucleotidyltransferase domain-containing protein [Chloroflexota bacterium]|nr:nucleotidyltransferase domain-containing protein [Chloroflexota bacterium]
MSPIAKKKLIQLARRYGIELMVLFGSRARGDMRPDSDLDLGVVFAPRRMPTPLELSGLETQMLDLLRDDVHLVTLNFVNPELRMAAAREGRVLYRRGDAVWTRFVIQNLHLLHDSRRLRQCDNDLIERFLEKRPNDENLQRRRSAPPHRRPHAKPRAA